MRFKSEINNQIYEIDLKFILGFAYDKSKSGFKLSTLQYLSDKLIGSYNAYPSYNKNSGIISWIGFDDLEYPEDIRNFCQRLINNRMLM